VSRPFLFGTLFFVDAMICLSWRWWCVCVACGAMAAGLGAQEAARVYRCGNEYTNQPDPARQCKLLSGGHVTVIEGPRVLRTGGEAVTVPASSASDAKVDIGQQRQRDAQAQAVLQAELQKAQAQRQELLRQWNQGEPERRADELKQPQKYQERVAQLRAALQRVEADVAGLQRELARFSLPLQGNQ
jgi:hypothetical protein